MNRALTVKQRVRPSRVAFLIEQKNASQLEKAVSWNTALWGGKYNPIFEVQEDRLDFLSTRLKLFDVDFVCDVSKSTLVWEIGQFKRTPFGMTGQRNSLFQNSDEGKDFIFCDVVGLMQYQWDKEFRITKKSNYYCPVWEETNQERLFLAILFGLYPEDMAINYKRIFTHHLFGFETETKSYAYRVRHYLEKFSPIDLTTINLKSTAEGRRSWAIIYIGNTRNIDDLLTFWNLRALGYDVLFVPFDKFKGLKKYISIFFERKTIKPIFRSGDELWYPQLLFSNSLTKLQIRQIHQFISSTLDLKHLTYCIDCDAEWVNGSHGTNFYFSNEKEILTYILENKIEVEVIKPKFPRIKGFIYDEIISNTYELGTSYGEDDYITNLPFGVGLDLGTDRWVITAEEGASRNSRRGFVVYKIKSSPSHQTILLPKPIEVFREIFKSQGYKIELSQPGRYVTKIIEKMNGIDGCRMFKVRGIVEIVNHLNDGKHAPVSVILKMLDSSKTHIPEDLFVLSGRRAIDLDKEDFVDWLVEKKIIRPGLKFKCQSCGKPDWYHVSEFSQEFRCRFCFSIQSVPRLDRQRWYYKADGLFQLPNKIEGSIPTILSIWRIRETARMSSVYYVPNFHIFRRNQKVAELDYMLLIQDRISGKTEIVLGEARGGVSYKANEVRKAVKLKESFPSAFLCFSTMKDNFDQSESKIFSDLKSKISNLILLTRKDLEPYHMFDRFSQLPEKYPVTLTTFANNTQLVNL